MTSWEIKTFSNHHRQHSGAKNNNNNNNNNDKEEKERKKTNLLCPYCGLEAMLSARCTRFF